MMSEKKRFQTNDLVKFNYSEIGEYVDEEHTPTPLRNDELCKLLNELHEENQRLKNDCSILVQSNQEYKEENEQLKAYKLYEDNKRLQSIIAGLKKENEQLKKENDDFHKSIKEYEDLRKRLNKDKSRLIEENMSLGAFVIEKGLMEEYMRWENE